MLDLLLVERVDEGAGVTALLPLVVDLDVAGAALHRRQRPELAQRLHRLVARGDQIVVHDRPETQREHGRAEDHDREREDDLAAAGQLANRGLGGCRSAPSSEKRWIRWP